MWLSTRGMARPSRSISPTSLVAFWVGSKGATSGEFLESGSTASKPWAGTRAEVLSDGPTRRTAEARAGWQQATRAQLKALMMAEASTPTGVEVRVLSTGVAPFATGSSLVDRDNNEGNRPAAYHLDEIE